MKDKKFLSDMVRKSIEWKHYYAAISWLEDLIKLDQASEDDE